MNNSIVASDSTLKDNIGRFKRLYNYIITYLTSHLTRPNWAVKVAFWCVATTLFFSLPSYERFFETDHDYVDVWDAIARQIEHPLTPHNYPEKSHEAKIAFRLMPALIGKLAPFSQPIQKVAFTFIIQQILGFFFFLIILKLAFRLTQDRISAFLFTFSFCFIYLGRTFFYELYPFFDGLSFFFMALALYMRNPWYAFGLLFFAYLTDERALVASPLILLYHLRITNFTSPIKLNDLLKKYNVYVPFILSLAVYGAYRLVLSVIFHLHTPVGSDADAGLGIILQQIMHIPLAVALTYEGYWLIVVWMIGYLILERKLDQVILLLIPFVILLIVAVSVWDVTRSICYSFPLLLIGLDKLKSSWRIDFVRTLLLLVFLVSFLVPTYKYHFHNFFWQIPSYVKIINYLIS